MRYTGRLQISDQFHEKGEKNFNLMYHLGKQKLKPAIIYVGCNFSYTVTRLMGGGGDCPLHHPQRRAWG